MAIRTYLNILKDVALFELEYQNSLILTELYAAEDSHIIIGKLVPTTILGRNGLSKLETYKHAAQDHKTFLGETVFTKERTLCLDVRLDGFGEHPSQWRI